MEFRAEGDKVGHTCDLNIQESEVGGWKVKAGLQYVLCWVHPGLERERDLVCKHQKPTRAGLGWRDGSGVKSVTVTQTRTIGEAFMRKNPFEMEHVVHTFNPSTPEVEAGGSLWVPGQPELRSKICPEKPNQTKPNQEKSSYTHTHTLAII